MLKRLYVHNYKTLVDFEITFDRINLLLGENGSGKTAVFEVLDLLRGYFSGITSLWDTRFPTTTRWSRDRRQIFEIELNGNGGTYRYRLEVTFPLADAIPTLHITRERLEFANLPIFEFDNGNAQFFDIHGEKQGDTIPLNPTGSPLSVLWTDSRPHLGHFVRQMRRLVVVRPIPHLMADLSSNAARPAGDQIDGPTGTMADFFAWFYAHAQNVDFLNGVEGLLRDVLPGFEKFEFQPVGDESVALRVWFRSGKNDPYRLAFRELSDGQRMLIALYALLHLLEQDEKPPYILCLDEPDNFVALREVQPWLMRLFDACDDGYGQAILISHHSETINYLLGSPVGIWFEREFDTPTRLRRLEGIDNPLALNAAELIARGWLDGHE